MVSKAVTDTVLRYYPEARAIKEHQEHHAQQPAVWGDLVLRALLEQRTYLTCLANNVSVFDRYVQGDSIILQECCGAWIRISHPPLAQPLFLSKSIYDKSPEMFPQI